MRGAAARGLRGPRAAPSAEPQPLSLRDAKIKTHFSDQKQFYNRFLYHYLYPPLTLHYTLHFIPTTTDRKICNVGVGERRALLRFAFRTLHTRAPFAPLQSTEPGAVH